MEIDVKEVIDLRVGAAGTERKNQSSDLQRGTHVHRCLLLVGLERVRLSEHAQTVERPARNQSNRNARLAIPKTRSVMGAN
jgi:hypothetical protein